MTNDVPTALKSTFGDLMYRLVHKKGNPLLAAILKYFLKVINLSVYIFGQVRLFYVSGEEIVEKDERMCMLR